MNTKNRNVLSKTKSTLHHIGLGILGILTMIGCDKDNTSSEQGKIAISAKGKFTDTNAKSTNTEKEIGANVVLSEFLINLKEFELEFDLEHDDDENEQWDDDGFFDYEDEIELEGPFELDLLKGEISFIETTIPVGTYEEIEFKIDKSKDSESELFGKSILIKGTVENVPFVFWHDFDEEIEVDFDDPQTDIVVLENQQNLTIQFDLTQLLNAAGGVNLSQAADGNQDGLIEISPTDPDGNNAIADQVKEKLEHIIDLLDD